MIWQTAPDIAGGILESVLLAMPRILVCIVVLPLFPASMFPTLLRVSITLGLCGPVAVGIYLQMGTGPLQAPLAALVFKEAVIGLILGLSLATPFWLMDAVGSFTDNVRGSFAGQQSTPFAEASSSVIGAALQHALVVFMASAGCFSLMYRLMLLSYEAWPVLTLSPSLAGVGFEHAAAVFSDFTKMALLYAAPMLIVGVFVDLVFAMIGIFAPQLQSYFAAMPVKSLASLFVLVAYLTVLLGHGENYFMRVIDRETQMLRASAVAR